MKKNCPFCHIQDRERIVREGKFSRVIFSNPRLVKGHLLVMPKRHIEKPWEITKGELNEIFKYVHEFQKKLSKKLGTGCDIKQNYRPFLKEGKLKIDHLHFHLLPRTFEDELYQKSQIHEKGIFQDLSEEEVSKVNRLLK